jgi:hypothetical protein
VIKGVGEVIAAKMVAAFGERTLEARPFHFRLCLMKP